MRSDNSSRVLPLSALILASVFGLASCGLRVSKGDARRGIGGVISVGMDKAEVVSRVESLKVNGVKPVTDGYVRGMTRHTVIAPDGKGVEVGGHMSASFSNGVGGRIYFCPSVGAIFYFDKSEKLITYHIDCFG